MSRPGTQAELPSRDHVDMLEEAAECLRTIAHPTRLKMIQILLAGPQTVGELALACGIPSNQASEHLRLLKDRRLLAARRQGRFTYYEIAEPCLGKILDCISERFSGQTAG